MRCYDCYEEVEERGCGEKQRTREREGGSKRGKEAKRGRLGDVKE